MIKREQEEETAKSLLKAGVTTGAMDKFTVKTTKEATAKNLLVELRNIIRFLQSWNCSKPISHRFILKTIL